MGQARIGEGISLKEGMGYAHGFSDKQLLLDDGLMVEELQLRTLMA